MSKIICVKDLYNGGLCFKKDKVYHLDSKLDDNYSLINQTLINELGIKHRIGNWYKNFRILEH